MIDIIKVVDHLVLISIFVGIVRDQVCEQGSGRGHWGSGRGHWCGRSGGSVSGHCRGGHHLCSSANACSLSANACSRSANACPCIVFVFLVRRGMANSVDTLDVILARSEDLIVHQPPLSRWGEDERLVVNPAVRVQLLQLAKAHWAVLPTIRHAAWIAPPPLLDRLWLPL